MAKFKDLFNYIQIAARDEFGYNNPFPNKKGYPQYLLHIYNGRNQVNFCVKNGDNEDPISIANFVFYPEDKEVCPVRVASGRADYDCTKKLSWEAEITKKGLELYVFNPDLIATVLRELLGSDNNVGRDAVTKFLNEVKEKADSLCIDFCIVAEGGSVRYSDHWATSVLGRSHKDPDVESMIEHWRERYKWPTFSALYYYIQAAEVDVNGNHDHLHEDGKVPERYLHIYDGRLEVDLYQYKISVGENELLCKFVFGKANGSNAINVVDIIPCGNNIPDTDHPYTVPLDFRITPDALDDAINNGSYIAYCIKDIIAGK